MWKLSLIVTATLATSTLATATAWGQTTTSSGTFGSRSLGSGISSRSGSSALGGAGSAAGATTQADNSGQVTGSARFMRGNRQGQFVGGDSADTANIFSQMGGNNRGGLGGLGNLGALLGNTQGGANQPNNNSRTTIPTQRVVAFDIPRTASPASAEKLNERFQKMGGNQRFARVLVNVVESTAVLTGTVRTENDRVLAAQVVLLEGGISQVKNGLVVANIPPPVAETLKP